MEGSRFRQVVLNTLVRVLKDQDFRHRLISRHEQKRSSARNERYNHSRITKTTLWMEARLTDLTGVPDDSVPGKGFRLVWRQR